MKIIVSTVAFSTNKLLVSELNKHFLDVKINEKGIRVPEDKLVEYFKDADGIIVGLEKISSALLDQLPALKIISKYGVGLDNIDLEACRNRNIIVGWTGGINKRSVAEMALGFMLACCRNLYSTSNQLKSGNWVKDGGYQLTEKTIGIIGFGNIGKELFELLKPFNCTILVNDIVQFNNKAYENVIFTDLDTLYKESDFISLHTPLTPLTKNLITKDVFLKMKSTSFLINTARGGIVNQLDLKYALMNKLIQGAAIDVYDEEPPQDTEFLNLPNLISTPHTGGNAKEAVFAMGRSAIDHLVHFKENFYK